MEPDSPRLPGDALDPVRSTVKLCADCDTCRLIMAQDCAFFPEMYRLWDLAQDVGEEIAPGYLRRLTELCTLCGLCPCPRVPMDLMAAKADCVAQAGVPWRTRLTNDVPQLAKICTLFPPLVEALQHNPVASNLLRRLTGVHPHRQLPQFARQSFFAWARQQGLERRRPGVENLAYFVGCTAGYLFPEVGRALVEILRHNQIHPYLPPQGCCGMPQLVEGDRHQSLHNAQDNLQSLGQVLEQGDGLISSCPTCSYFFKNLLKERAVYSPAYQTAVGAGADEIRLPGWGAADTRTKVLKKSIYHKILKDDGYFSGMDPLQRVKLADGLQDAGDYLLERQRQKKLNLDFAALPLRAVYFAPCHQRQQNPQSPYLELLNLIPALQVERVGADDCCGMGGNFGFKKDFHQQSLALGRPLFDKISAQNPEAIITDCLSCRLQFQQSLRLPVYHPLEILAGACRGGLG
jgi:glycerol-3-phosphate dehydrogenase subunit C